MKSEDYEGLKNGSYFYISNRETKLALTFNTDAPHPKLSFDVLNESRSDQIWMIEEVQQNRYEIVHAFSTMVLTANRKGAKLAYGTQSNNQLFFVQKSNPKENPLEYWIKENKTSDKLLYIDLDMKCDVVNPRASKARWELKRISQTNELLKSCLIQFAYSGLYLDVPGSSIKAGVAIAQYSMNARCNQRWKLIKFGADRWMFLSVRSEKCLMVSKEKEKAGTAVVQENILDNNKAQQWKLHHQGGSLYIIESCLREGLFLGVRGNSMDENAGIVTTDQEEYAFWRIIGELEQ